MLFKNSISHPAHPFTLQWSVEDWDTVFWFVCRTLPIAMFQWRLPFHSPGQRGLYLRKIINRTFSYIILGDEKNVSRACYFVFLMHSSMISYRSQDWEAKRCRLMLTGSFLDLICKVLSSLLTYSLLYLFVERCTSKSVDQGSPS